MNKLCCVVNGNFQCANCSKSLCPKHIFYNRPNHNYGFIHKVQRCLGCHRKFVQRHRTGETKLAPLKTWFSQISRRQMKQGKPVLHYPYLFWP